MEFELAFYDVTVQLVSPDVTVTTQLIIMMIIMKIKIIMNHYKNY